MDRPTSTALLNHFAALEDPRQTAKVLYPLPEILLLLLSATLAGAEPWREKSGDGISLATGYAAADAILDESGAWSRQVAATAGG